MFVLENQGPSLARSLPLFPHVVASAPPPWDSPAWARQAQCVSVGRGTARRTRALQTMSRQEEVTSSSHADHAPRWLWGCAGEGSRWEGNILDLRAEIPSSQNCCLYLGCCLPQETGSGSPSI